METAKMLKIWFLALGLSAYSGQLVGAEPMGTAFTYQGQLYNEGYPANGRYDFQFKLYDGNDPCDANPIGGDVDVADVNVVDGYFTVKLDFGSDVFTGDGRWLGVGVRPTDMNDSNYTPLNPPQEVTPTPYALQTRGIFVDDAGNVGIGTTGPSTKMDIQGNLIVGSGGTFTNTEGWESVVDLYGASNSRLSARTSIVDNRFTAHNTGGFAGGPAGIVGTRSNHSLEFITNGIRRMTVKSDGFVGIGTEFTPAYDLDIAKDDPNGNVFFVLHNLDGANPDKYMAYGIYGSNYLGTLFGLPVAGQATIHSGGPTYLSIGTLHSNPLILGTNNAERVRIDSSGNVGIGTTSPTEKLEVNGNLKVTGNITGGLKTYDSGWFAVSTNTTYSKTHNLGTTKVLAVIYVAADSSGTHMSTPTVNSDEMILVSQITTTTCVLRTRSYIARHWNGSDWVNSSHARIIMLALE